MTGTGTELEIALPGDAGGVFAALSAGYTVRADPSATLQWTYVDTIDWRLHCSGLALREVRDGRATTLELHGTQAVTTFGGRRHSWPVRADRLGQAGLRDSLADVAGTRALLPLAEVESRRIVLRLLDEQEKTRVRVLVDQQRLLRPRPRTLPMRVTVAPIRGYERDGRQCVSLLEQRMAAEHSPDHASVAAFVAAGRTPPNGHPDLIAIDPDAPIGASVAAALRRWLTLVETSRDGIVADLDPDFLLTLRTGAERSVALLGAAADVLGGEAPTWAAGEFAYLLDVTRPTRSLDLGLPDLGDDGRISTDDLGGLDRLRESLVRRRRSELARVRAALKSSRFEELLSGWPSALDRFGGDDVVGPSTAAEAAGRVARAGRALTQAALPAGQSVADPDALQCGIARLDALARAFSGLAPDAVAPVVADLARLQRRAEEPLAAHDLAGELTAAAHRLRSRGASADEMLAIGALRERVRSAQVVRTDRLARAIARWATGPAADRVTAMLDALA